MKPVLRLQRGLVPAVLLAAWAAVPAHAQLISIQTAPVGVSEQFWIYPAQLKGMGGGLALRDLDLDPFSNPARAARIAGVRLAASPNLYSIPEQDGSGRTLPVSAFADAGGPFVGGAFAVQELESAFATSWWSRNSSSVRTDRFAHNTYGFGLVGHRIATRGLDIALSAAYSRLDKVHAVDLLYPQSRAIEQEGKISDIRLGVSKAFAGERELEAVLVRNAVDVRHDVTYVDWRWDAPTQQAIFSPPRIELNRDQTTTWGAHLKYSAPASDPRWRWATALTANVKSHPKIPNYEFMSIPRDPGDSYAFRAAIGGARVDAVSRIAFDLSYEPVWTSTWAEAAEEIVTERGTVIPKGGMTVENEFVFSTYNMHAGYSHRWEQLDLQLGIGFRNVSYALDQYNALTGVQRDQDESWREITPTWGLSFDLPGVELRYAGQRRGGGFSFERAQPVFASEPGPDIVAAPTSPLSMDVTRVVSHQFTIAVPIGGTR